MLFISMLILKISHKFQINISQYRLIILVLITKRKKHEHNFNIIKPNIINYFRSIDTRISQISKLFYCSLPYNSRVTRVRITWLNKIKAGNSLLNDRPYGLNYCPNPR